MNILYVTTIASTMGFFVDHIKLLQAAGNTVELACNDEDGFSESVLALGCPVHRIPFSRAPLSGDNLRAFRELKRLIHEHHYDIIHTHTPNASAMVRLAARDLRRGGTRVFYTAHGFHFYTGAPLKNRLLYYPVEWLCSFWTDVQITINREDYERARKHLHAAKTVYTHGGGGGVGLRSFAPARLSEEERAEERRKLGVQPDEVLLINVGELSHRKNQETLLRAMAKLGDPGVKLIICGEGDERSRYEQRIKELGLSDRVRLLGHRSDVARLYVCSDVFVFPSRQEGLSAALLEAMACGLPAVCSAIRGNVDLIEDGKGGFLHAPDDADAIVKGVETLARDAALRRQMGERNREEVKKYGPDTLLPEIAAIYGIG